jgi:hypothetical protein
MKVKVFDCGHEGDLEKKINEFIKDKGDKIIDIKFSTSVMVDELSEQIYCFSALIVYKD